jgi:hypothetical protein
MAKDDVKSKSMWLFVAESTAILSILSIDKHYYKSEIQQEPHQA